MTLSERALGRIRTRADQVRARRAKLVREIEPVSKDPLLKRHRRKRTRRRYDFALPTGIGVEARLPAIPTVHLGSRLLTIFLLSSVILALGRAFSSNDFYVEQAKVLGNKLLSNDQARSMAQVDGNLVFLIDPQQVADQLMQFPEVLSAQVDIGWPNQVEIQLVEREPIVEWDDAGRAWWMSADGVAFIQHGSWPDLIKVKAEESILHVSKDPLVPVIKPEVLSAAVTLSAHLPEIEILNYDSEYGLGIEDGIGSKIYFGVEGDMAVKVRMYQQIAERLSAQNIHRVKIFLMDQDHPFYRVER
ncbi:MAG TPA: FtsQ-type POTRA domain-containing protein [Anaerolineae bacterium]|nr:FtsQ-type POTRA domain-containing protein [Anaerolineae bacterium]